MPALSFLLGFFGSFPLLLLLTLVSANNPDSWFSAKHAVIGSVCSATLAVLLFFAVVFFLHYA